MAEAVSGGGAAGPGACGQASGWSGGGAPDGAGWAIAQGWADLERAEPLRPAHRFPTMALPGSSPPPPCCGSSPTGGWESTSTVPQPHITLRPGTAMQPPPWHRQGKSPGRHSRWITIGHGR
jgi:hypothetical protein